jgi:hypothetical protein
MQGYYTIHKLQKICTDKTQVNMENHELRFPAAFWPQVDLGIEYAIIK